MCGSPRGAHNLTEVCAFVRLCVLMCLHIFFFCVCRRFYICTWHSAFPHPDRRFGSDHLTAKMRGATHRSVAQSLGPDYVEKEQGAVSSDHFLLQSPHSLLRTVLALAHSSFLLSCTPLPLPLPSSPCPQQHTANCYAASFKQVPSPLFPQAPSGGTRRLRGTDGS
jgi:hypothetical protein